MGILSKKVIVVFLLTFSQGLIAKKFHDEFSRYGTSIEILNRHEMKASSDKFIQGVCKNDLDCIGAIVLNKGLGTRQAMQLKKCIIDKQKYLLCINSSLYKLYIPVDFKTMRKWQGLNTKFELLRYYRHGDSYRYLVKSYSEGFKSNRLFLFDSKNGLIGIKPCDECGQYRLNLNDKSGKHK